MIDVMLCVYAIQHYHTTSDHYYHIILIYLPYRHALSYQHYNHLSPYIIADGIRPLHPPRARDRQARRAAHYHIMHIVAHIARGRSDLNWDHLGRDGICGTDGPGTSSSSSHLGASWDWARTGVGRAIIWAGHHWRHHHLHHHI